MAKKSDIDERLTAWKNSLWMDRAFLFSSTDEFDDWCSQPRSRDMAPVRRAARFFKLDPAKPVHMALLLRILADVTFRYRRAGRRSGSKKWSNDRLYKLAVHSHSVTKNGSRLSDTKIAKLVVARYRADYPHGTDRELRKKLPSARREYDKRERERTMLASLRSQWRTLVE